MDGWVGRLSGWVDQPVNYVSSLTVPACEGAFALSDYMKHKTFSLVPPMPLFG